MEPKYKVRYCSNANCSCNLGLSKGIYTHDNGVRHIRVNKFALITILIFVLIVTLKVGNTFKTKDQDNNHLKIELNQVKADSQQKDLQIQQKEQEKVDSDKSQTDILNKTKSDYDAHINDLNKQLQSHLAAKAVLASVPAAKVVPAGGCEAYRGLVSQYNWPVQTMLAISMAESGCNPGAISPANSDGQRDYGLFQIHGEPIMDASANVARAYQKYVTQGLTAWSVYKSGSYLRYLSV